MRRFPLVLCLSLVLAAALACGGDVEVAPDSVAAVVLRGDGLVVRAATPARWGDWTLDAPGSDGVVASASLPDGRATLRLHRYDAAPVGDPPDDPFGLTASDKQAAVAAMQRLWDTRAEAGTTKPGEAGPELAPRGLFWGNVDYFTVAHAVAYAENAAGDLRGLRIVGTAGQDVGFAPHVYVWLGRPADRVVLALDVDLADLPDVAGLVAAEDAIAKGPPYVASEEVGRAHELGRRLTEVDELILSLTLSAE